MHTYIQMEETMERSGSSSSGDEAMKVVVAVDESDGSFHALTWAIDHLFKTNNSSDQLPNRTLLLLHAQKNAVDNFVYPVAEHVVDSIRKAQEQNTKNVISRAMQLCKEREITAEAAVVDGDAKGAICEVVEQTQADLVVVGSRGLGKIKRALILGSVSDYVAHYARCPVLIVKPPRSEEK